jgi:hypothetical protein
MSRFGQFLINARTGKAGFDNPGCRQSDSWGFNALNAINVLVFAAFTGVSATYQKLQRTGNLQTD